MKMRHVLLWFCLSLLTCMPAWAQEAYLEPVQMLEGGPLGDMLAHEEFLFISQFGNGRVFRCDKPITEEPPCVTLPGYRARSMTMADGILYISTEKAGVFFSRNKGTSFGGPTFSNEDVEGKNLKFYQLATTEDRPIIGTSDGVYLKTGEDWVRMESFDRATGQKGASVRVLAADGQRIAAAAQGNYLYYTSNGGKTWKYLPNIAKKDINSLIFRGNKLYVGVESDGVWRIDVTTLETETLNLRGKRRKRTSVTRLAFVGNLLLAGLDRDGLWASRNSGKTWFEIKVKNGEQMSEPRGVSAFCVYKDQVLVGGDEGQIWALKQF